MKNISLHICLALMLCPFIFQPIKAQNNALSGVILYQNSNLTPVPGVRISGLGGTASTDGANAVYTTNSGEFFLTFSTKKVGDRVRLVVGKNDATGQLIEVVNQKEFNSCRIPSDPSESFEIIVCRAGQRDLAMQRYYNILETAAKKELRIKQSHIDALLAEKSIQQEELNSLIGQKDSLQLAFNDLVGQLEDQAYFIASVNRDRASKLVNDAIDMIENEQDIELALEILDFGKLTAMHESNQTAIEKLTADLADSRFSEKQVLEALKMRINLLIPSFRYDEAITISKKMIDIHQVNDFDPEELTWLKFDLGDVYTLNGMFSEAEIILRETLQDQILLMGYNNPDLAYTYFDLAHNMIYAGNYAGAPDTIRRAIQLFENLPDKHPTDLMSAWSGLGSILAWSGDYKNALEAQLTAKTLLEEDSTTIQEYPDRAISIYSQLAVVYSQLEMYDDALEIYELGLNLIDTLNEAMDLELQSLFNNVATIHIYLGNLKEALRYADKSLSIQEERYHAYHPRLATSHNNIGLIYHYMGELDSALVHLRASENIRLISQSPLHPDLAGTYNNLALVYRDHNNLGKALDYYLKTLNIDLATLDPDHPYLGLSYFGVADVYFSLKRYERALEYHLKAFELRQRVLDIGHSDLTDSYQEIGLAYLMTGQPEKAQEAFKKCDELFPDDHRTSRNWAMYYSSIKEIDQALDQLRKSVSLGFEDLDWLKEQEAFEKLHNDNRFLEIVNALSRNR